MSVRQSKPSYPPPPPPDDAAALSSPAQPQWAVLFYLAGDLGPHAQPVADDLREILAAGASEELAVVVQYDGPEGASRYLLPVGAPAPEQPIEQLGRVDSGAASTLAEFLRWALSMVQAPRIALVLSGHSAIDTGTSEDGQPRAQVFSICRDDSAGSHLDAAELGAVIREVLAEHGREQIDLLAGDTCHLQFLELAYELEGRVQVLLSSQTLVPDDGWDYTRLLSVFTATLRSGADDVYTLSQALVPAIRDSYRGHQGDEPYAVSALDLRQLDDVARAFDTICISMLQVLGEGLIWEGRKLLLSLFDDGPQHRRHHQSYDCGSLFVLLAAAMDAMADEAVQGWLGTTLQRASGPSLDRFRVNLARQLRSQRALSAEPARIARWAEAVAAADHAQHGAQLIKELNDGVRERLSLLAPDKIANADLQAGRDRARARDAAIERACRAAFRWLPPERQFDFERLTESITTARRLADQGRKAATMLLGERTALLGVAATAPATKQQQREGLVIAAAITDDQNQGWPRWSGVSLYRPPQLDKLMNPAYQRFAFHERIHWAALLGAANLISDHPRALWRLVSSLLSTGAAGTRRDLLRRLTGADSVVWGLRDQFRVMAPAPMLSLSLERRAGTRSGESVPPEIAATRENYLLRLESASRGAIVTEQQSRVQPQALDRALRELDELLAASTLDARGFARLRSIGGLLGEDIFQTLGRTLEEERAAALAEAGAGTVHLQLQIPRELMRYPWELLHHRGDWLSERFAVGRQVFMETGLARRVTRRHQGRVRPLIVGDPLFDPGQPFAQLPGARAEAEQVAGWFESLRADMGDVIDFDRERDALIHTRITSAELRARLRDGNYDIVHFAGHGVFNPTDPETSAWLLSDGALWALEIRNTLAEHPAPPWLVYANACEAGMDGGRVRYQGNVFGLATAFINQGVAAYIAPLWPIDDLLAQQIALDFYRQLLCERITLGEALRRAKVRARATATPAATSALEGAWTSLGWASLVLYGDPTEELFQALAGSSEAKPDRAPPTPPRPRPISQPAPRAFLHAPDHVLDSWLAEPGARSRSVKPSGARSNGAASNGASSNGASEPDPGALRLELIEEAGLRRFRVLAPGQAAIAGQRSAIAGADGLPGSDFARLLSDERVRSQLPGRRGFIRVIGRWLVSGFDDGLTGLVREYDREQVPSEGLLLITPAGTRALTPETLPRAGNDSRDRVLLLVHGTFSKTAAPVEGFGPDFLGWAHKRYRAVLGLDHWTLSKTPLDNAQMLAEQLRILAPELLSGRRLDIITHSRGGLVARSFCGLLDHADAVGHLIFLGTPNCGTDLANPKNWGVLADSLVNMTGLDHAELFGRLAGLLARLAVMGGEQHIPGLLAQNPLMAGEPGSFLHRLQQPFGKIAGIRHAVVTAEFEPSPLIPNLKQLWSAAKAAGIDSAADALFADANDLVVNTANVWCVGQPRAAAAQLPAFLRGDRVLAFIPPSGSITLPANVVREVAIGVHHCNLFGQPRAQTLIKQWLSETNN